MRRGAAFVLSGLALLWQPLARADVWAYVSETGVAHFASERLDARYERLYAEPTSDAGAAARGPVPMAPARLLAFFAVSPGYKQVRHLLREASREHDIDYALLQALIATESGFDARAVSPKGAVGLMQVMPATAGDYGVLPEKKRPVARKLADPRTNIQTGSRHLRQLMARFPGQLDLALAAYNAGLGAVRRAGNQVPPYRETQNYVRTVLQLYELLKPPTLRPLTNPPPEGREPAALASLQAALMPDGGHVRPTNN